MCACVHVCVCVHLLYVCTCVCAGLMRLMVIFHHIPPCMDTNTSCSCMIIYSTLILYGARRLRASSFQSREEFEGHMPFLISSRSSVDAVRRHWSSTEIWKRGLLRFGGLVRYAGGKRKKKVFLTQENKVVSTELGVH